MTDGTAPPQDSDSLQPEQVLSSAETPISAPSAQRYDCAMRKVGFLAFFVVFCPTVEPILTLAQDSGSSNAAITDEDRGVSLKEIPANVLSDQKRIWLFPASLAHGEHVWPAVFVLAPTAAFLATDAHTAPKFRNTTNFHSFNHVFSNVNSGAIMIAAPVAVFGIGYFRKDSYAEESALLAGEAVADSLLLNIPFKIASARREPLSYSGNGPYTDSFFHGSHSPFHTGGFFSGHAATATALATVFAHRYRQHRWVPIVAYGLAGAISFSRVSTNGHFAGDAFFGGALGFVIARYAVLPAR